MGHTAASQAETGFQLCAGVVQALQQASTCQQQPRCQSPELVWPAHVTPAAITACTHCSCFLQQVWQVSTQTASMQHTLQLFLAVSLAGQHTDCQHAAIALNQFCMSAAAHKITVMQSHAADKLHFTEQHAVQSAEYAIPAC